LAVVAWLKKQPWYGGSFAFMGQSWLGYSALAIASEAGPDLKALAVQVATPDMQRMMYPGGVFSFATWFLWMVATKNKTLNTLRVYSNYKKYTNHLPIQDNDVLATKQHQPHWHDWLAHPSPDDAYWRHQNHWHRVPGIQAPVQLMGGWFDFFLPDTLRIFTELRKAGRQPQLIVGPWTHRSAKLVPESLRESLAWFNTQLLGQDNSSKPVRLYLQGANEWHDYETWPLNGSVQTWFLQPDNGLAKQTPTTARQFKYTYDPADPTPSVGGISNGLKNGLQNQWTREKRSDVITFTGSQLEQDTDVIGAVRAELFVSSSLPYADFFVRLCDVDEKGKSVNVSDGVVRIYPNASIEKNDEVYHLTIEMYPTAYRFKRNHRLRLQVSSGSFPHYIRNYGTGESIATATKMKAALQTIHVSSTQCSSISVTVVQ